MDCLVAPGGFILILGTWFYKIQVHGFTKIQVPGLQEIQQVWANILGMEHKMPAIHQQPLKKTSKNWQPFSHHGGPYGSKSSISGFLWTGFSARMSGKYSRGADGPPEGQKSKKMLEDLGSKKWGPDPNPGFFSKCQGWPWDHF